MLSEETIKTICEYTNNNFKKTSTELVIRCPYCGDSKDSKKKHLYVQIDNGQYGYMFHCFKCNASGTLIKLLRDLKLLSPSITADIMKQSKVKYNFKELKKDYTFEFVRNKYDETKYNYIKMRLNFPIDQELPKYITDHIVTDFDNINILDDDKKKLMNESYVGFRTFNKRKIICRNITPNNDLKRYLVVDTHSSQTDFFMTSNDEFDVLSSGRILVGEGVITTLSGYLKLKDKIKFSNFLLVAGAGKSYLKSVLYATYTFGLPEWQIYILADTDVKKEFLQQQFYSLKDTRTIKVLYCDKNDFADDWKTYSIENLY